MRSDDRCERLCDCENRGRVLPRDGAVSSESICLGRLPRARLDMPPSLSVPAGPEAARFRVVCGVVFGMASSIFSHTHPTQTQSIECRQTTHRHEFDVPQADQERICRCTLLQGRHLSDRSKHSLTLLMQHTR